MAGTCPFKEIPISFTHVARAGLRPNPLSEEEERWEKQVRHRNLFLKKFRTSI